MPRTGAIVSAVAFLILSMSTPAAVRRTTDTTRAGMCDGYDGVAFTFCVAYCEARECDAAPVGDNRCEVIRRGFARVTGGATPPCSVASSRAL